ARRAVPSGCLRSLGIRPVYRASQSETQADPQRPRHALPAKQSVRSILLYRMAICLFKTTMPDPRGGHLMRKVLIGVAAAALLAGCTTDPQPRAYSAGYGYAPPPPPPRNYALGDACGELGWGKVLGGALGGAAGGAIISNIARGHGSGVATAAGVIGGMLLGGFAGSDIHKGNCAKGRAAPAQARKAPTPVGRP